MRISTSLIFAGAIVVGFAGLAPTLAREFDTHTVTVRVPGGGVETIEYTGKVAPMVSFQAIPVFGPVEAPFGAFMPIDFPSFTPIGFPSFAALDRITAAMDRQMDAMMHETDILSTTPQDGPFYSTVLNGAPRSTTTFSIVSEASGNGVCTHMTQITQSSDEAKPHVVAQTSGNCGADSHSAQPATVRPATNTGVRQINYRARLPFVPVQGPVRPRFEY
jgi:hypothetical protein